MKKLKKLSWWDEFKAFAIKGNAMALAVGTIIGAAFSNITKSLTDKVLMPVINMFLGGMDFSEMKLALPRMPWVPETLDEAGNVVENYLYYGDFIAAVINFFIIALVVFAIVKCLNKLAAMGKKKEEEAPPAPPAPSAEEVLLAEIRDLLKNK